MERQMRQKSDKFLFDIDILELIKSITLMFWLMFQIDVTKNIDDLALICRCRCFQIDGLQLTSLYWSKNIDDYALIPK